MMNRAEEKRLEKLVNNCQLSGKYRKQKVLCKGKVFYCTLLFDASEAHYCPCAGMYINIPKGEYKVDVPYLICDIRKRPEQVSWLR